MERSMLSSLAKTFLVRLSDQLTCICLWPPSPLERSVLFWTSTECRCTFDTLLALTQRRCTALSPTDIVRLPSNDLSAVDGRVFSGLRDQLCLFSERGGPTRDSTGKIVRYGRCTRPLRCPLATASCHSINRVICGCFTGVERCRRVIGRDATLPPAAWLQAQFLLEWGRPSFTRDIRHHEASTKLIVTSSIKQSPSKWRRSDRSPVPVCSVVQPVYLFERFTVSSDVVASTRSLPENNPAFSRTLHNCA